MGLEDIAEKLRELAKIEGRVGILPEEGRAMKRERRLAKDGTVIESTSTRITVAEAAIYNELGTLRIPARPVYRATARHPETRAIIAGLGLDLEQIPAGTQRDAVELFKVVGARLLARLSEAVQGRTDPHNAPATIEQKGFDDPLINTRQTLQSLSFEIRKSGRRIYKRKTTE